MKLAFLLIPVVALLAACDSTTVATTGPGTVTPPPPPPPPVNAPSWVAGLSVGQWYRIPNTAISSVDPSPEPDGLTGPSSKVIAWTSFVVDTRDSRVYSVANGGHNDYAGNEVDVLELETETPSWSERLAPTPDAQLTNCQSYYADGRPASRHSYYGVTLDEVNGRIMLFGGAKWCMGGGFHSAISSYNIGSNTFNGSGTHPGAVFLGVTAYSRDPNTGDVYGVQGGSFGRWRWSSNSFSTSLGASGTPPKGDESMSAFDTTRGRILFVGGLFGDSHYYTVATNAWTGVSITGSAVSGTGNAMFYVPAMDRYLVRLDGGGGAVFQINPQTFQASAFPTTGGSAIPSTLNGPYNKFLYVPRLQGAIYVPSYSEFVWFLRLH
jgi:hypothetical protein